MPKEEDKATKGSAIWKSQGIYGADDTGGLELKLDADGVLGVDLSDPPDETKDAYDKLGHI